MVCDSQLCFICNKYSHLMLLPSDWALRWHSVLPAFTRYGQLGPEVAGLQREHGLARGWNSRRPSDPQVFVRRRPLTERPQQAEPRGRNSAFLGGLRWALRCYWALAGPRSVPPKHSTRTCAWLLKVRMHQSRPKDPNTAEFISSCRNSS